MEETLSRDMQTMAEYYETWQLKLNMSKTTVTAFHLNNSEAKKHMNVKLRGTPLTYTCCPSYLSVKLDRQLTFNQHLTALISAKISACNCLLRRLAGCNWGVGATTLRKSALALVFSSSEYAAPV